MPVVTPNARRYATLHLRIPHTVLQLVLQKRKIAIRNEDLVQRPADPNLHFVTALYGLPPTAGFVTAVVQKLLSEHPITTVEIRDLICFTGNGWDSLAFEVGGSSLYSLRDELLTEFRGIHRDPWVLDWRPHVTLAHLKPHRVLDYLVQSLTRKNSMVALPVESVEIHRPDGSFDVLSPHGRLAEYPPHR